MPAKKKIEEVAQIVVEETMEDKTETPFDVFISHQRKAITEAAKALEEIIPEGVREHSRKAFEEVVEGYRKLFNAAMDEIIETFEKVKFENEDPEQVVEVKETKTKEVKEPALQ